MSKHNGMSHTQPIPIPPKPRQEEQTRIWNVSDLPQTKPSGLDATREIPVQSAAPRRQPVRSQNDAAAPAQRRVNVSQGNTPTPPRRPVQNGSAPVESYEENNAQQRISINIYEQDGQQTSAPAPEYADIPQPQQAPKRKKQSNPQQRPKNTPPTPNYQKKKKKKKRRRRPKIGCCLTQTLCYLVVLLFALYSGISLLAISKLAKEPREAQALPSAAVYCNDKVQNILVIGSDSRGGDRGRADTMIILSISRVNKTITMTSVMRDSYVSIPNYGTDKLNAAYAYGGPSLLMDTIENNYRIQIDDYICVNFQAMAALTDALGGVEMTITDGEAQAINTILHDEVNGLMGDPQDSDYLPSGGTYVLNGKQALSYSRIRYVGNADFERTERQRKVLNALVDKVKGFSFPALGDLFKKAMPQLSTNMTTGSLYWMSLKAPYLLAAYDMQQLRMPADGTYSDQTTSSGAMVLAVDFDANLTMFENAVTQAH